MPDTTPGHSATFEFGDEATVAASNSFTKLAGVTEIGGIAIEADDVDVSNMDSPEQFREFDPGWADAGEVEITLQFAKTQNTTLYGLFRVPKGFRVAFADGSTWEFDGYIKGIGNEIEREGIVSATVTAKISGKPAFTAGI
ncbi:MAG: phage tail tube protein [Planctomycetota bacterium]